MKRSLDLDDKLNEAIRGYAKQLAVIKPGKAAKEWVKSQCLSAREHIHRSEPNRAIACCKAALRACNRQRLPRLWAWANYLAGVAHIELTVNRISDIEAGITYLKAAAAIYTKEKHLEMWAEVTLRLLEAKHFLEELDKEEHMESVWGPIKAQIDEKLCFVMMPFSDPGVEGVYDEIIKPVVESNGLIPKRADSFKTSTPIMPDVWRSIITAQVLIADLTNFNTNVYYELGLCHSLNKTPILMIQEKQELPFDLKHFRAILYSRDFAKVEEAKEKLDEFIKEALRE